MARYSLTYDVSGADATVYREIERRLKDNFEEVVKDTATAYLYTREGDIDTSEMQELIDEMFADIKGIKTCVHRLTRFEELVKHKSKLI